MTTLTVKIWHNVRTDDEGRHPAFFDGYTPGDPMVCVFAYQTSPGGRSLQQITDHAFAVFNGHPFDDEGERLAGQYYERRLRSLSAGDVVSVGEAALAVGRPAGWVPVTGSLHEVRTDEPGTHPLPLQPVRDPATASPYTRTGGTPSVGTSQAGPGGREDMPR
jgi:hypothetical protein